LQTSRPAQSIEKLARLCGRQTILSRLGQI
jgi:hypothetical protein